MKVYVVQCFYDIHNSECGVNAPMVFKTSDEAVAYVAQEFAKNKAEYEGCFEDSDSYADEATAYGAALYTDFGDRVEYSITECEL